MAQVPNQNIVDKTGPKNKAMLVKTDKSLMVDMMRGVEAEEGAGGNPVTQVQTLPQVEGVSCPTRHS